jgi:hypothetical protein
MVEQERDTNGIRKEVMVGALTVDKVYVAEFQKEGTKTAQLRQVVKTKSFYPSKKIDSSHQDNPFALEEFGFEEQEYDSEEKRVTWINIPEAITDVADVLAKFPQGSMLYKVMSNRPTITDHQAYSIDAGILTIEQVADKQIVKYGEGHEKAGQLILDNNGKPQYRSIFYSNEAVADVDNRTEQADDFYATVNVNAVLSGASVMVGQEIN